MGALYFELHESYTLLLQLLKACSRQTIDNRLLLKREVKISTVEMAKSALTASNPHSFVSSSVSFGEANRRLRYRRQGCAINGLLHI